MDLLETWKKLDHTRLSQPLVGKLTPPDRSKHTVARLRRNYYLKISLTVLIILIFMALIIVFDDLFVRLGLSAVVAGYLACLVSSVRLLNNVKPELPIDRTLMESLRAMKNILETDLRFEKYVGLTLYPFAAASGFIIGFMQAGRHTDELYTNGILLAILAITVAVVTPICFFLAQWLHKKTYGKCLRDITMMIEDLKTPH